MSAVVASQGVQKALGGSGMVPDITVESLNLGRFGAGKTSVATRIKILRDFFRVRAARSLASWGGDSLLMEESGRGQKELYFFPSELVIRSVGSAADKVYAPL